MLAELLLSKLGESRRRAVCPKSENYTLSWLTALMFALFTFHLLRPFGCWNKMGWNENDNGNGNEMEWNDYFIIMFGMVGNGME